jgi:hypothetical protein
MRKIKVKKGKIEIAFLIIIFLQIFLLMNMNTARSYMIHQTDNLNRDTAVKESGKKLIDFGKLLLWFLSIKQIGTVSAQDGDDIYWTCCPEMNDGSVCEDISSLTPELCAVEPIPTKCDNVAGCEKGCCIDTVEGLCTTGSAKEECEDGGGVWDEIESCLIDECQNGCCVLGDEARFVTEKRCERLSSQRNYEKDFRDIDSELECLALTASQTQGACITGEICLRETEEQCLSDNGNFYANYLCSNPVLDTGCERQASIGCADGEDGIYWFDSCGNMENIYSSNKDASWNNGKILKKEESCGSGSGNIDSSTCGNCDRGLSSICSETKPGEKKVLDGNFICEDLRCSYTDQWGNKVTKKNGERWCIYDSYIGDGKDTVGSEHWLAYCHNGEVELDGCDNIRRGDVCQQTVIEENGETFSSASCVPNEAIFCISYNQESDMQEKCNENKHCMIKNVNIDTYFQFDVCVPRYPRGFDLSGSSISCAIANNKCTVYYEKDWKGRWRCKENCGCVQGNDPNNVQASAKFVEEMNDLCISLGECGTYVNYLGEGTNNIRVTGGSAGVTWEDYVKYAEPVEGQYVEPQDIDDFLSSMTGNSGTPEDGENDFAKAVKFLTTVSGASGMLIGLGGWYLGYSSVAASGATTGGLLPGAVGSMGTMFTCAAIGAVTGAYLANYLERSGDAATVLTVAGGMIGLVVGYFLSGSTVCPVCAWVILIVAIITIIYTWLSGWGKTTEREVSFTCLPWRPPTGEADCKACNEDPSKPCTEYRCESIGQTCKLLNKKTENPICESIPREVNPPVINLSDIEEGYEFVNEETKKVEIRKISGGCVEENIPMHFTLKTDEPARCKYELQKTNTYEDMGENYPAEENRFTENHTFAFNWPHVENSNVDNVNMYIRCEDYWGNFNINEYIVNFCIDKGPDMTAAWIQKFTPKSESHIGYNETTNPLTIYLNEPAECKYDVTPNKNYDSMSYTMNCNTETTDAELYGWPCSTTMTWLIRGENKFYIKCKDKPWVNELTEEEKEAYVDEYGEEYLEKNINVQDYIYTLYGTENALKINSVLPQGVIKSGFEPAATELKVTTSGGVDDGKAQCYYKFSDKWIRFADTFSDKHRQSFDTLMRGNYNIDIKCEDEAGNVDYGNSAFTVKVDSSPPVITRIYNKDGNLILATDEEADCYYSSEKCNFNIDEADSMTIALSKEHSARITPGKIYYVKCLDNWGNSQKSCTKILQVSKSF